MDEIRTLLVCKCEDPSHQLIFSYLEDEGEPCVLCEVILNPDFSFFRRLFCALRYVFCRNQGRYGNFSVVVLGTEHYRAMRVITEHLRPWKS